MLRINLQFFGGRGAASILRTLDGSSSGNSQIKTMKKEEADMRGSGTSKIVSIDSYGFVNFRSTKNSISNNDSRKLHNKTVLAKSTKNYTLQPATVNSMANSQVKYMRQVNPNGHVDLVRTGANADAQGLANDYSNYCKSIWKRYPTYNQQLDNEQDNWLRTNARKYGFSYSRR